jgi:predicted anti-sigma-YlaC factor YlaD
MSELRITDTNSANNSRGRAFGLEGNDFIYVLVAFVVALGLYLVFAFVLRVGMAVALLFSLPVLLIVSAWVLCLRHNKPDGYAEDVFDDWVNGDGWSLAERGQSRPPGKDRHAQ